MRRLLKHCCRIRATWRAVIKNRSVKKLRTGIVGLGHVAAHQIDALSRTTNFRLVAACDQDLAAHAAVAATVDTYKHLDDLLARSDVDVVIVATPNKLHVEHGIRVLEAGKRLVIEKPVAETPAEFDTLADTKNCLSAHCTVALHAAFGVEVDWFVTEVAKGRFDDLEFDSFHCQFYDPYVLDGRLQPGANSLGGSWIDSGVNALSVVCRILDPANLEIADSRITRRSDLDCLEVGGSVDFAVSDPKLTGLGTIDTDWTTGQNLKVTTLGMKGDSRKLVLHHSNQTVVLLDDGDAELLFESDNGLPRLTNHYIGVFNDLARQIESDSDNLDYGRRLHDFLYRAETWCA